MGWRERDWATFDREERNRFYGPGGAPYIRPSPSRQSSSAVVVAVAISVAAGIVAGTVELGWSRLHRPAVTHTARIEYGVPGPSWNEPHLQNVCTEEAYNTSSRQWVCLLYAIVDSSVQVVAPAQYQGTCGHLQVDQAAGAWVCLSQAPPDPSSLPAATAAI